MSECTQLVGLCLEQVRLLISSVQTPKGMTEHFLLQCPICVHERWLLLNQASGSTPKLKKLLTSQKLLTPLANYIEATGRFDLEGGPATVSGTH